MANHGEAQRTVTQGVISDDHKDEMWATGAKVASFGSDYAFALAEKADQAKMNNFSADAKIQMMQAQQDWRSANQNDPMNPDAIAKLNGAYDKILNGYSDQVSLLSRGKWQQHSQALKSAFADDNYTWGVKQSITNAENQINDSMIKNNAIAQQLGRNLDETNAQKNLTEAQAGIDEFTRGLAMDDTRKKITKNFQSDYIKNFVMGMAQTNPDKADAFLNRPEIQQAVGTPEHVERMRNIVKRERQAQMVKSVDDAFQNRLNVAMGIATGKINANDPNLATNVAKQDQGLGEALQTSQNGDVFPTLRDQAFSDLVNKQMIGAKSQEDLGNVIVQALKQKISRDRLAILVDAVRNRAKSLPVTEKSDQPVYDPAQGEVDGGTQAISSWGKSSGVDTSFATEQYLKNTNSGMPAKDAYKAATKAAIVKEYPQTATLDEAPNMVLDKDSNIKVVFPSTTKVYPNRIYDGKSFKLNPETHPEAQKKK